MQYLNFDIHLGTKTSGAYPVRATSSNYGEFSGQLNLDTESAQLKRDLEKIRNRQTDEYFLKDFGSQLHDALLAGVIGTIFQRSYGDVQNNPSKALRIRLIIEAPELSIIPWELMYSTVDHTYLAARRDTALVRYHSMPIFKRPVVTAFPIKILVVAPSSSGLAGSDVERHILTQYQQSLGASVDIQFAHSGSEVEGVTWASVERQVYAAEFNVLHFIGHGVFSDGAGKLEFDDGYIDEGQIATLANSSARLSLIVLNSCDGARHSRSEFSSTATQLVINGVPAVVAMQYEILDVAAVDFAEIFFRELFVGLQRGRIEFAMSIARQQLFAKYPNERELAVPVLVTHTDECLLFIDEKMSLLKPGTLDLLRDAEKQLTLVEASNTTINTALTQDQAFVSRKLWTAKQIRRISMIAAVLIFCMAWMKGLDLLNLDTSAEQMTMAFGDIHANQQLHDQIEIIKLKRFSDDQLGKQRLVLTELISQLIESKPKVIAVDTFFSSTDGKYNEFPDEGERLASEFVRAASDGIAVVLAPENKLKIVPDSLNVNNIFVGHACTDEKLGVSHSLPLYFTSPSIKTSDAASVVAELSDSPLAQIIDEDEKVIRTYAFAAVAVKAFNDSVGYPFASEEFPARTREQRADYPDGCTFSNPKGFKGVRYLRMSSDSTLELRTTPFSGDDIIESSRYAGKLVLVGYHDDSDIVHTNQGHRAGYMWHADAINTLLMQIHIKKLHWSLQFAAYVVLISSGLALRKKFMRKIWVGRGIVFLLSVCLFILSIWIYTSMDYLVEFAYLILALISGWILFWLLSVSRQWR